MIEDGFYWIKLDADDDWQPANLVDGRWWVLGCEEAWLSGEIHEVGAQIKPPEQESK